VLFSVRSELLHCRGHPKNMSIGAQLSFNRLIARLIMANMMLGWLAQRRGVCNEKH